MHIAEWFSFSKVGILLLFNNWVPSCKSCQIKRLSKVIPAFKNADIEKGHHIVCGRFIKQKLLVPKTQRLSISKKVKKWSFNEINMNMPIAPDWRPVNEKKSAKSLQNNFQISKWSSKICSISLWKWTVKKEWKIRIFKNMLLFQKQGKDYHSIELRQMYDKLSIDISIFLSLQCIWFFFQEKIQYK